MNDDELINQVYRKIEREKVLINAANNMRQSSNPQVQQSLDSQIRESRKGIDYLEERMRELQMRRMEAMGSGGNGGPVPPTHGASSPNQRGSRNAQIQGPPIAPIRTSGAGSSGDEGDYGDPGNGGYMNDMSGGHGMMPPRAPFGPPGPGSTMPKSRPNFTKLGSFHQQQARTCKSNYVFRPHKVRYALPGTSHSVDAIPAGVQTKRGETIQRWRGKNGQTLFG